MLLERFREVLPEGVKVTVLADRGFGDQALYELLKDQLGFDFVVRFRGIVKVTSADGETQAGQGRGSRTTAGRCCCAARRVTKAGRELGAVVCVKAKGMKDAWCLATSHGDKTAAEVVKLYAKRFTIEESFRDQKNLRFGMGLSETRISSPAPPRPDAAGERHRHRAAHAPRRRRRGHRARPDLKTNTVKTRTLSLLNQGLFHYAALPKMKRGARRAAHGEVRRDDPRSTPSSARSSGSSE